MSAPCIRMEQLNAGQWHFHHPEGWASGVQDWLGTLTNAIWWGTVDGFAVKSVDLAYREMTVLRGDRSAVRT